MCLSFARAELIEKINFFIALINFLFTPKTLVCTKVKFTQVQLQCFVTSTFSIHLRQN